MRRQRGIGFIGLVLAIAAGVFVVIVGMKVVPVYMEYFAIKRALVNTAESTEARNATTNDLRKAVDRRFMIDNIKSVAAVDVDITKEGGNPVLSVNYSVKEHLFANVSACLDFEATSVP